MAITSNHLFEFEKAPETLLIRARKKKKKKERIVFKTVVSVTSVHKGQNVLQYIQCRTRHNFGCIFVIP